MARIRTIKPEFWEDEKVAKLSIPCRLLFVGTWTFADDLGCIKGNAALIKSQIFPYDENLRVSEIKKWIDSLVEARMLIPIIHAEESYYYIRTFRSHQIIDKRYSKSYIGCEKANELINKALEEYNITTTSTQRVHDVGNGNGNVSGTIPLPPKGDSEFVFENSKFKAFQDWIMVNAPNVAKMNEPFTEDQYTQIREKYSLQFVTGLIVEMHNWKYLKKKNVSAYLTFLNWAKRRKDG